MHDNVCRVLRNVMCVCARVCRVWRDVTDKVAKEPLGRAEYDKDIEGCLGDTPLEGGGAASAGGGDACSVVAEVRVPCRLACACASLALFIARLTACVASCVAALRAAPRITVVLSWHMPVCPSSRGQAPHAHVLSRWHSYSPSASRTLSGTAMQRVACPLWHSYVRAVK